MTVESASYIADLNDSYPSNTDYLSEGDNHITMIKTCLQNTFATTTAVEYDMDDIKDGLNYLCPIGMIVLWYGASGDVPTGWKICNGGTHARTDGGGNITCPNLTTRFVMGATEDGDVGDTGGATTDNATTASDGAHTHTLSGSTATGGSHNHTGATASGGAGPSYMGYHDHGGGAHTHQVNCTSEGSENPLADWRPLAVRGNSYININTATSGVIVTPNGTDAGHTHGITTDSGHTHTLSTGSAASGGAHTHTVTVDILPTYMKLYYIMKI